MKKAFLISCALIAGCSDEPETKTLDREALMKPSSCEQCHSEHVRQWSGSMHAYASFDPVFRAMNARGQRETNGELGDFCVRCHAPMAVATGATNDGLNLDEVPDHLQGVTCYFCHTAEAVAGSHNNPLVLATDDVLRGAIADPVDNPAHHSAYSPLLDRDRRESADACGSCHDIVTPKGVHLERTYAEWQTSQFGNGATSLLTCGNCHMPGRQALAADFEGVRLREVHDHALVGVDVALTEFPERQAQLVAVERELSGTLIGELCVLPPQSETEIQVRLENAFAGHMFPSGAAQDRRAWIEVIAFSGESTIYESGVVPEGMPVVAISDPDLWLFRDTMFDASGNEVHMFWEAESYESELLPQASTPNEPHRVSRTYRVPLASGVPDRVTLRVLLRPMGLEVLQDLVETGDLDASIVEAMPTFTVVDTIEWTDKSGYGCVPDDIFDN